MINVYIIDDSASVRILLAQLLSTQPGIEVIGAAANPVLAWRRLEQNWPDVIICDLQMPQMDGISFLKKIMAQRPTPVIICSAYLEQGSAKVIEALSCGAVEVIPKPKMRVGEQLTQAGRQISNAVRAAATAIIPDRINPIDSQPPHSCDLILSKKTARAIPNTTTLIAIGCSTGGPQALEKILPQLPNNSPAIVIVQHMPENFTATFANRLNQLCLIRVKEAQNGEFIQPGNAYVSPGHQHLIVTRSLEGYYQLQLKDGPPVNRHKPSVDVLFRSVAQAAGQNAIGYLLTGMGKDGAKGLLEMRQANAVTYAQDECSSAVFGMPGAAVQLGAAQNEIALEHIADSIIELIKPS